MANQRTLIGQYLRSFLPAIAMLVFTLYLWYVVGGWFNDQMINNSRSEVYDLVMLYGSRISIETNRSFATVDGLVSFPQQHMDDTEFKTEFSLYAAGLYAQNASIRAIEFFPGTGPVLVYPIEGNEAVLGRTLAVLRSDPRENVRADVQRAIETRKTVVSAPYELQQGGLGVVARKPFYSGDKLRGLAVVILDVPAIIESTGLTNDTSDISLAIKDGEGRVFWGDKDLFNHDPVLYTITLPDGVWQIAGVPEVGWEKAVESFALQYNVVGLAFVFLVTFLTALVSMQEMRLRLKIRRQTMKLQQELDQNKKMNAALRESEEKFRTLAENSQDYIMRYDRHGRHIYINPAGLRVAGLREAEVIGKTHREAGFDPSMSAFWEQYIHQVIGSGKPLKIEFEWERPGAETIFLDWALSPEFDEDGQVRSVLGISRDVTNMKQMEMAVRENEERFRMLFNYAPVAYQSLDYSDCIIDVNDTWQEVMGYTRAEVTGKWFGNFLIPESREGFRLRFEQLFASGSIRGVEFGLVCKDGRRITASFDGHRIDSPDRASRYKLLAFQDVTARKEAEQALRENEERLRLALKAANQGWYDFNLLTEEVLVSPEYARMLGYEPDTFVETQASWRARLHPDDLEQATKAYEDYLSGQGGEFRAEWRQRTRDGKWAWVLSMGQIVEWDEQGKPARMLGTNTDISQLKRIESRLRESERRLQEAEEAAHIGHWSYDIRENRFTFSTEIYHIFNISPDQYPAPSFEQVFSAFHPDDRTEMLKRRPLLEGGTTTSLSYRLIQPGGQTREVMGYGKLERNAQGEPETFFGLLMDITDVKQKERELERKNADLENFTYTISHDLKSPLVTIKTFLGYLEQDLEKGDSARAAQDKQYIHTAVDKMGRLLEEILEVSRIGRIVNPSLRVTYNEVAQEAVALVAGRIDKRGVQVQIDPSRIVFFGDRPRLVQIWQNLLENAIKFMGNQQNPQIEIGVDGEGREAVFFVKDNGIGIAPRFHRKIFGLFEKLEAGGEGTGMGLALIKRVVEFNQGKIWVESGGEGKGSCFRFTLPGAVLETTNGGKG